MWWRHRTRSLLIFPPAPQLGSHWWQKGYTGAQWGVRGTSVLSGGKGGTLVLSGVKGKPWCSVE